MKTLSINWVKETDKHPELKKGEAKLVTVCNQLDSTQAIVQAMYKDGKFYAIKEWDRPDAFIFEYVKYWSYDVIHPPK